MLRIVSARRGLLALESAQRKPLQLQVFNTSVKAFANAANEKPSYVQRQQALGRPVSPHVTIYAFPLAAISSVTHRITGGMLTVGLYGMGLYALVGGEAASLASALGSSAWGPLIKFSVTFPLTFHFLGGLRHFYWEIKPEQLTAQTQYQAAAALFAGSGAISLIAMFL